MDEAVTLACADPAALWRTILEDRASDALALRWQRLHSMGLGPERSNFDAVDEDADLARRREQNGELGRVADATVPHLGAYFAERGYKVVLTDTEGVVIRSWGGGRFSALANKIRFFDGAHWAERIRGTNAVGVALEERRPAAVLGAAHYERALHVTVCYASPIFDAQGAIVGVIDASSELVDADPFAMIAVCSLARAFEQGTMQRQTSRTMVDILERVGSAAMVAERTGKIVSVNESAARLLGLPSARVLSSSLEVLLDLRWPELLAAMGRGPLRVSVGGGGRRVELIVHVDPAFASAHQIDALTLRIEPARARHLPSPSRDPFGDIFGTDDAVLTVKRTTSLFARSKVPVLILSETGTGKELLARAIHRASDRADNAFVAINCGALPETLLATELFGYVGGAFSGALRGGSEGKLGAAHGGTLFLDEIAEMPASLQAMLLRVLEDGSYYRVGDNQVRQVDVRLVSATCRDLRELVKAGKFRDDLSYRIKGAVLTLPPVRAREDLAALAAHLLDGLGKEAGTKPRPLSPEVIAVLERYDWPGNVRELKAALQYALVVADGATILPEHLPQEILVTVAEVPDNSERLLIERAMAEAHGRVEDAATQLGVSRATLYRRLKRLGRSPLSLSKG